MEQSRGDTADYRSYLFKNNAVCLQFMVKHGLFFKYSRSYKTVALEILVATSTDSANARLGIPSTSVTKTVQQRRSLKGASNL